MTFSDLKLSPQLLKALTEAGYKTPSDIQEKAIPKILNGHDLMAAAQTGTGKTASFALPILEKLNGQRAKANQVRALVLTPTRELAAQVGSEMEKYGQFLPLKTKVVFGGVKINPQMQALRGGSDVLVATPGRLLDLASQNAVKFKQLEFLVLDEADRMLDMGFIHDLKRILKLLPTQRQSLLFSATFSADIKQLAKGFLNKPHEIAIKPKETTAIAITQKVFPLDKKKKPHALVTLIRDRAWQQVLVFAKTKHGANRLVRHLEAEGFRVAAIHGNKSQAARTRALSHFKSGEIDILVATDLAARGLDIKGLPQVVNFELPQTPEDYVHRIGRTGRAGKKGNAYSLVSADECNQLFAIERLIKKTIPRQYLDDFIPQHELPQQKPKNTLKKQRPR